MKESKAGSADWAERELTFAQWPEYGELEMRLLREVLESGKWGGAGEAFSASYSPKLLEMERRFADLHDAKYAASVVNGTVAITVALQALGIKSGDEVIVPPYTFIATASAALAYGVIPRFADIDPDTLAIDPDKVEKLINDKTKAIIAVHIGGAPADMRRLSEIARRHNLFLIEDAAQAVGAKWDGKRVGTLGDIATFSLQSSKNLNCWEGGVILTDNQELYEKAWSICNVGRIPNGRLSASAAGAAGAHGYFRYDSAHPRRGTFAALNERRNGRPLRAVRQGIIGRRNSAGRLHQRNDWLCDDGRAAFGRWLRASRIRSLFRVARPIRHPYRIDRTSGARANAAFALSPS
ncbi:DegT/DnrJ/EryC1/StrS family aminotransferase [Paenibacillus nasutitermitis]|uniref:DegT/DnrJ/EryC1/StrS family aminotransferase n=1 Tax=Paenibacillus nasutitermitis TaxID=1652958 RepID=A0A917E1B6_9BACL|nr:DegT/DnrJ/EryC1/StrS family aminotransferase [Paenibacillus nasutitermitis]GGD88219.1 hypothetical protein GCM10010911_53420 [Paenibacillus nasutitermitis]